LLSGSQFAATSGGIKILLVNEHFQVIDSVNFSSCELSNRQRPSPLRALLRARKKKNRKIVAALLSFPFPFGIVGLHRIYLGTAPYVPVAYIASLGGVFGILPFIDFCVLLIDKDVDKYLNNQKVFMWIH
jgi:TM2 domain-containing membrane protein YozV